MERLTTVGARAFVATGFQQRADGAALMRQLESRGIVITCDWTTPEAQAPPAKDKAARDKAAIRAADVVIALMTLKQYAYRGTNFELGYAEAQDKPIIMISPFKKSDDADCARNVYFWNDAYTRFDSVDAFLAALHPV